MNLLSQYTSSLVALYDWSPRVILIPLFFMTTGSICSVEAVATQWEYAAIVRVTASVFAGLSIPLVMLFLADLKNFFSKNYHY